VVTHAVPVAARLAGQPQIELHLLPGRVRPTTHAAVGADTVAALHDLRADVAFVATNGLSLEHGLTTPDRDEAATKRAIVGCARRVVVLADSSKLGVETAQRFASLRDIDVVVTDAGMPPEARRALDQAGVQVVVA
jgi:DeoR family fructose operon transcriptional repressor